MKHYLLTLAAALLLAAPSVAQTTLKSPVTSNRMANKVGLKKFGDRKFFSHMLPANSITALHQPALRADASGRSATELSYQVDGTEISSASIMSTGITESTLKQYSCTGIGAVSYFSPDILKHYVGNTISSVNFCLWMGNYSGVKAIILDAASGNALWSADVNSPKKSSSNGLTENNIACNYEITGEETSGILVGWMCSSYSWDSSDPYYAYRDQNYGVITPFYLDNTSSGGQGFYFLGVTSSGQWGVLKSGSRIQDSSTGQYYYTSAYVYCETTGSNGLPGNDLMLYSLNDSRVNLQSSNEDSTTVAVVNEGMNKVASFDYTFECDGQTKTGSYNFDEPLPWYSAAYVNLPIQRSKTAGVFDNKFTITTVNSAVDEYTDDNTLTAKLFAMNGSYNRTPVVEEYTSTYCGWCPRGIVGMDNLAEKYGDDAVLIAVHTDDYGTDPLTDESYESAVENYNPSKSYPGCIINREYGLADPYYEAEDFCEQVKSENCEANMVASGKVKKSMMGSNITLNATVDFKLPVPANQYGLMFVITEDGITGVNQLNYYELYYQYYVVQSKAYTEANFYNELGIADDTDLQELCKAGGSGSVQSGYYYEPTFNHVSVYTPDVSGSTDVIPVLAEGESYSMSKTLTLPTREEPAIVTDNLKAAVVLVDLTSGMLVTGRQIALTGEESTPSSIENATADGAAQISLSDCAFTVKGNNAKAEVFSADGKLISSCTVNGEASLPTFGKGVFVIRVTENGHTTSQKAVF